MPRAGLPEELRRLQSPPLCVHPGWEVGQEAVRSYSISSWKCHEILEKIQTGKKKVVSQIRLVITIKGNSRR